MTYITVYFLIDKIHTKRVESLAAFNTDISNNSLIHFFSIKD